MRRLFSLILIAIFSFISFPAIYAAGNLGLAIEILPSNDKEIQALTTGQSLWFVIPPGQSKSRTIRIKSSANIKEEVTLSIGFLNRIDGVATVDDTKKSEIASWGHFSENRFVLAPSQSKEVNFNFEIPNNTDIGIHEAFLYAVASPVSSSSNDEYKLIQNARIASPIFLGVGTAKQIYTDFEIKGVSGIVNDGVKSLKIDFKNTGKTPLNLSGTVELTSLEFSDRHAGPYNFNSLVIRPDVDAYVLIPTNDDVKPGNWKIFVSASQLSKTKTKEFSENITFRNNIDLVGVLIRIIGTIFFLFVLYICIRTIRGKKKDTIESQSITGVVEPIVDLNQLSLEELEAILAARLGEKSKKVKKATAKKPVKKSAAQQKKSTAPIKKSAKKVAKKAPINKASTKKVAKKAAVKRSTGKK